MALPTHKTRIVATIGFYLPVWTVALSPNRKTTQDLLFSSGVLPVHDPNTPASWNAYIKDWVRRLELPGIFAIFTQRPSIKSRTPTIAWRLLTYEARHRRLWHGRLDLGPCGPSHCPWLPLNSKRLPAAPRSFVRPLHPFPEEPMTKPNRSLRRNPSLTSNLRRLIRPATATSLTSHPLASSPPRCLLTGTKPVPH